MDIHRTGKPLRDRMLLLILGEDIADIAEAAQSMLLATLPNMGRESPVADDVRFACRVIQDVIDGIQGGHHHGPDEP